VSRIQLPRPGAPVFDPTAGLFLAQDSRPPALGPVSPGELTPLQRALLVIDGTVTTFLEAWALEPVEVRRLWQREARLGEADPWLGAGAGTAVLHRAVMLMGGHSGSFFAFAESRILPSRLPPTMRQALEEGAGGGIGQILLACGTDTRREGLWFGRERPERLPEAVSAVTDGEFLTRTYRVSSSGEPWMLITERFPWRPVALPSGDGTG
jgi:chorismate-pyruvate lyase